MILGAQSRGSLLGTAVALHLGVGLVEARKNPGPASDSDQWLTVTTPPDYKDRHVVFGFRRELIRSGEAVLFVDDWMATGSTALAARSLVEKAGADWLGAAVIVAAVEQSQRRRDLGLRSLMRLADLPGSRASW